MCVLGGPPPRAGAAGVPAPQTASSPPRGSPNPGSMEGSWAERPGLSRFVSEQELRAPPRPGGRCQQRAPSVRRPAPPRRSPRPAPRPHSRAAAEREAHLRSGEEELRGVPGSREAPGPVRPAPCGGSARRSRGHPVSGAAGRASAWTGACSGAGSRGQGTGAEQEGPSWGPEGRLRRAVGRVPGLSGAGAGLTVILGMLFLPWKDILLLGRPVQPSSGVSGLAVRGRGRTSGVGDAQSPAWSWGRRASE